MDGSTKERISAYPKLTDAASRASARLDLLRLVLEFVGKCLYPMIVVVVLLWLRPVLAELDLNALIGRVQGVKAGGVEFTFAQAQDVAALVAPLNARLAELERNMSKAQANDNASQEHVRVGAAAAGATQPSGAAAEHLRVNAGYTVLVFHRATSHERARAITNQLLQLGYHSSDMETDFSELKAIKPADGLVYMQYTSKGQAVVSALADKLRTWVPQNVTVRTNGSPIELRRGDLQIFVF